MRKTFLLSSFFFVIALPLFANIQLTPVLFSDLPGWQAANLLPSLSSFQNSCRGILSDSKTIPTGTYTLPLATKDWTPACTAALKLTNPTQEQSKTFFEKWFTPMAIKNNGQTKGLFTGYYLPSIPASRTYSKIYNVPIYGKPYDLISVKLGLFDSKLQGKKVSGRLVSGQLFPYNLSRKQIDAGGLKNKAPIVLWTKTRADRFFLQIQGSGVAKLENGKRIWLGYDGDNGGNYYAIGRWFVQHGIMSKQQVSMQNIYLWLEAHPKQADQLMNLDDSFVFFKLLNGQAAIGSEKVPLTSGYSLAIDNNIIPFGVPLWLSTKVPDPKNTANWQLFQRLIIAQDTGGAIRGAIRGDIFFGDGTDAASQAGYMKNSGQYWLLLPKTFKAY